MGDEPLIARFHECFPLYTAVGLFKYGDIDSNHIFCRFQKLSLRKKRQWLNRQDAKYIKVHIKTCVTNDYGFRRLFAEYIRPYDPFCDAPLRFMRLPGIGILPVYQQCYSQDR